MFQKPCAQYRSVRAGYMERLPFQLPFYRVNCKAGLNHA